MRRGSWCSWKLSNVFFGSPFESQVKTAKPKKAAAPAAAFGAMAPAVPQVDKAWRDAASKWGHFPNIGWLEPRKLNKKMMVSIFFWYFFRFFWRIIPTLWFYWCLFLGIGLNYSHLPIDFNQCLTPFWGLCSFSTRLLSTESERLLRAANQPSGLTFQASLMQLLQQIASEAWSRWIWSVVVVDVLLGYHILSSTDMSWRPPKKVEDDMSISSEGLWFHRPLTHNEAKRPR